MGKILMSDAEDMRCFASRGGYGTDDLAALYDLSRRQVQRILAGEAWLPGITPNWLTHPNRVLQKHLEPSPADGLLSAEDKRMVEEWRVEALRTAKYIGPNRVRGGREVRD